jgi:hypothetical protein
VTWYQHACPSVFVLGESNNDVLYNPLIRNGLLQGSETGICSVGLGFECDDA